MRSGNGRIRSRTVPGDGGTAYLSFDFVEFLEADVNGVTMKIAGNVFKVCTIATLVLNAVLILIVSGCLKSLDLEVHSQVDTTSQSQLGVSNEKAKDEKGEAEETAL
jgi:hypothetical protein